MCDYKMWNIVTLVDIDIEIFSHSVMLGGGGQHFCSYIKLFGRYPVSSMDPQYRYRVLLCWKYFISVTVSVKLADISANRLYGIY